MLRTTCTAPHVCSGDEAAWFSRFAAHYQRRPSGRYRRAAARPWRPLAARTSSALPSAEPTVRRTGEALRREHG
ncbi:hypothetical protein AVHM3334_02020 [Acidovorax sp. SUPP3334]|nr:hypothetical protein AVHM3334_02020 [Acidovorax sp. SUPP3334]